MNEEIKITVAHGDQEDVMDADDVLQTGMDELDHLIVYALSGLTPPLVKQGAGYAVALTETDCNAQVSLSKSDKAFRTIPSRAKEETASLSRADCETYMHSAAHSARDTSLGGESQSSEPAPDLDTLKERHRACREKREATWKFQCQKGRKIGSGGQGVVYYVQSQDKFGNSATRALKLLSPRPYVSGQDYLDDMQRMAALAEVVREDGHNNLLKVEHFGPPDDIDTDIFAMVMHLIEGFDLQRLLDGEVMEPLEQYVKEVDPEHWAELNRVVFAPRGTEQMSLTPGVAVNIIDQCFQGVGALHDRGILHCDLKPANIMLNSHGSVKLIDIGSAFQEGAHPRRPTWTPRYAPPEVLEKDHWSPQADMASLGYVLIELLTGQPELMGPIGKLTAGHELDRETRTKLAKIKRELFENLNEVIPEKFRRAPILMELCRTCIHPNPAERFASAEQAIVLTDRFKNELVLARLTVPWVRVFKRWLTYAKKAMVARASTIEGF